MNRYFGRFYICPRRLLLGDHPSLDMRMCTIFHGGCQWLELDDDWLLIAGGIKNSHLENEWHNYPEVARLTDPYTEEAKVPLADLYQKPEYSHKQFAQHHFEKLKARFNLDETHTVWDLGAKMSPGSMMWLERY